MIKPKSPIKSSKVAKPIKATASTKKLVVKAAPAKPVVKKMPSGSKTATGKPLVRKATALDIELKPNETLAVIEMVPAVPKLKLVRDSFTMPRADFDLVDTLKARALVFQRPTRKSELLRAGLHALSALSDAQLRKSLDALTPLKAGRPKAG